MPSYNSSPFAAIPQKLIPGQPAYLYGSWAQDTAPTKGVISNVALTSNVATVTVVINEGNVPAVGSLITIVGTASTSGLFNVTNVALTGVTLTNGAGTLTFALTHANVASAADGGYFIIPQPEVGDTVANGFSVPVGLPYSVPEDAGQQAQTVQIEVNFPVIPTACTVNVQGAMTNTPATVWQTLTNPAVSVAAGVATYGPSSITGKFNFLRFAITGTTNSNSATIVAKLSL
jgi:hypothetical protein